MTEYIMVGYPSKKHTNTAYMTLIQARKEAMKLISKGTDTQFTIHPFYNINYEVGSVFVYKSKFVYRREQHLGKYDRPKVEYGLWELNKDGTVGKRLG